MAHQWRPAFIISAVSLVLLVGTDAALPQRAPGECLNGISQGSFSAFPSPFQVIGSGSPVVTNLSTTVTFATGFQVAYFPTYKLVTNKVAYEGPFTYALVQCGLEPPSEAQLPANTKIFTIPLTSVAVEDTTNEAMMVALGLQARVSYVSQYAVDPCFQSLGLGGCMALTSGDANNKTDVNVANVDGIFGYQDSSKTIAVSATSDPGPLNRAEWIKFVATFFNKEDMANAFFNGVTQRYNTVKSAVAAQNVARKPVVAWIIWMPAGDYNLEQVQISFAQYKATFTQDAGGQMLDLAQANATARKYSSDVKYSFNSLILGYNLTTLAPQLREILADVDVLIEESKFPSTANADVTLQTVMDVYGFTAADQQNLKFLRNNKVLREDAQSNPQDFTTWFGKAVINPDVVLEEMARVITPAAVSSNASPQYLRLLGQQPSTLLQSSQCPLQNCLLSSAPSISNAPICPLVHRACDGSIVSATPEQRCAPTCASPPPPQAASMTTPLLSTLGIACILALVMALAM